MPSTQRIIVIGGGIGGVAAALALHRAGIDATAFERAPAFGEVGAGISLWPNATRVLRSLGVLDRLLECGETVEQFDLLRTDGSFISEIPMRGFPTPALCIHRARLHEALRAPLPPACLEAGQTFQSFSEDGDGIVATFGGGRQVAGAGLVGADGINSLVRSALHRPDAPVFRGYTIWRGIAPIGSVVPRGHISETWGAGRRFGIMPIGEGRTCWYATRNGLPSQRNGVDRDEISALFRGWHSPVSTLIGATPPSDIIQTAAADRPPLRSWGRDRITLLGDAAHPITPNVGQGACMAIEDAAVLAKMLSANTDIPNAFPRYEALRIPRTGTIARHARQIGAIGQWESPLLVRLRNLATKLVLARSADMRMNSVYGYEV